MVFLLHDLFSLIRECWVYAEIAEINVHVQDFDEKIKDRPCLENILFLKFNLKERQTY